MEFEKVLDYVDENKKEYLKEEIKNNKKEKAQRINETEITDRLMKIHSQLIYWGIDGLNEEGAKRWTDDITWLMKHALQADRNRIAFQMIQRNIDNKEEIQKILDKVTGDNQHG